MGAEEKEQLLSQVDLLESLSPAQISWLSKRTPDFYLTSSQILYNPSFVVQTLYLLLSGRMHLYKTAAGQQQTLEVLLPGMMFGEAALTGRSSRAYAQALEDSWIAFMSLRTFRELAKDNVGLSMKLAELLSNRVQLYESRMTDIALKEVPARLASLLNNLCEREGIVTSEGFYRLPHHYTHEQLAEMIGAKRVAVTRAFAILVKAQAIEVRQRSVYIASLKKLTTVARVE